MMKMPSKEEIELNDILAPWIDWGMDSDFSLKSNAPEEIKKKYDYWVKKYVVPIQNKPLEKNTFG